jgi:hypothetical protein
MSIFPANQGATGATGSGGLMALVYGWLADLPAQPELRLRQRAALQQELDAFAWQLVARMHGVDADQSEPVTEIPLDKDQPSR